MKGKSGGSSYFIKRSEGELWEIMHFIQKKGAADRRLKFDRSKKGSIIKSTTA
jgi:hypothetical protein